MNSELSEFCEKQANLAADHFTKMLRQEITLIVSRCLAVPLFLSISLSLFLSLSLSHCLSIFLSLSVSLSVLLTLSPPLSMACCWL